MLNLMEVEGSLSASSPTSYFSSSFINSSTYFGTPTEFFCARAYKTYCEKLFPCCAPLFSPGLFSPHKPGFQTAVSLASSDVGFKRQNWQDISMELKRKQNNAIGEGEGFWKSLSGTGDGGQPEPTT